jgi:hypothetical protein
MREPREKKTKVSLLDAVDVKKFTTGDGCFGKEWNPQDRDCSVCADIELCGIIYQDTKVTPKRKKFEKEKSPLDMADFMAVEWPKILGVIESLQRGEDPMTLEELTGVVKDQSKVTNEELLKTYVRIKLVEHNLKTDGTIVTTK